MRQLHGLGLFLSVAAVFLVVTSIEAAAAERVFIPLGSDDKILIVDAESDEVVGEISEIPAVHGLAVTPDGRLLVAGSYEENPLDDAIAIEGSDISINEHLEHHYAPADGGADGDPMFSTVSIISTFDGETVSKVDVPGAVHHVAISPDGRTAVVTHPYGDRITAIDLKSAEVTATVETGLLPNYVVFARDGSSIFVSNAGDASISQIETSQWSIMREIRVGQAPEHVVLSPDGMRLYVNNVNDGTVSIIDTKAGIVVDTIAVGATPHGIDISDDGATLFVAALGEDSLVAVDLTTGTQWRASLEPQPYHLAVIRRMDKLYVSSAESPWVWVIDQFTLSLAGRIAIEGKGHQMVQVSTK